MKHTDELAAALDAAKQVLAHLDLTTLMLVAEIGDYGIQIAIETDPITVRSALRGAADALDGQVRPVMHDVVAALVSRGWTRDEGVWRHRDVPRPYGSITEALIAQTAREVSAEVNVDQTTI